VARLFTSIAAQAVRGAVRHDTDARHPRRS
jgi:hypothetical protein